MELCPGARSIQMAGFRRSSLQCRRGAAAEARVDHNCPKCVEMYWTSSGPSNADCQVPSCLMA